MITAFDQRHRFDFLVEVGRQECGKFFAGAFIEPFTRNKFAGLLEFIPIPLLHTVMIYRVRAFDMSVAPMIKGIISIRMRMLAPCAFGIDPLGVDPLPFVGKEIIIENHGTSFRIVIRIIHQETPVHDFPSRPRSSARMLPRAKFLAGDFQLFAFKRSPLVMSTKPHTLREVPFVWESLATMRA